MFWILIIMYMTAVVSPFRPHGGFSPYAPVLTTRTYETGSQCCTEIYAKFGDVVSFPGSTAFSNQQNGTTGGYWTVAEQSIIPACRFSPRNTSDVASVIQQLANLQCRFAIRGAGHMTWAGAANIQDGVTIDLSSLSHVSVSADRMVTSAGPGCRWRDIYNTLDPMNLTVVGGRVEDVGIAGLTVGGGNSWFASRYGFVCDNIINFEIAIASGEVVNANISSHPDLYKALKGGGNNFGIVTRFDFRTFPQGLFWGGFQVLPVNSTQDQLQAVEDFTAASGDGLDDFAALESVYAFNSTSQTNQASIIVETRHTAFPPIFQSITQSRLQLANTLRFTNCSNLSVEASAGPNGINTVWATITFANNATTFAAINKIAQDSFANLPTRGKNYTFSNVFQSIPRSITRKSAATGGNVLGLDPNKDVVLTNFVATFFIAEDAAIINGAAERFVDAANNYTKSVGHFVPLIYMNYALPSQPGRAASLRAVIESYGPENVKFLQTVSRKYDPDQVFQRLVPGGFKLPG